MSDYKNILGKIYYLLFFFCLGVRGGPLFETTRAWFNFLRVIVSVMKRGYDEPQDVVEEDG